MQCNICKSFSNELFTIKVLHKYDVKYYKCAQCNFIQTEKPYWLHEAYANAITSLDIGLISRNQIIAPIAEALINSSFNADSSFIDYGGGYGIFVRMMRDKGFDFFRYDIYCENLFAKNFDISNSKVKKYELLTSFEVFEHLENPLDEIEKMLELSDNIFFTTTVYPQTKDLRNWWYLIPETGQHISIYATKTLEWVAQYFNLHYTGYNGQYHMFSKKKINQLAFRACFNFLIKFIINRVYKRQSLLPADFKKIAIIKSINE